MGWVRPYRNSILWLAVFFSGLWLLLGYAAHAGTVDTVRLDWAYYNPVSLVLRDKKWLEDDLSTSGIKVEWVQSLGSSRLQEHLMDLFVRHSLTMFFVTHDIEEAVALSDTIVVIKGRPGQISHQFRIDLPRPRSRHNQAFIGWKERVLEALTE
jgi:hypothetical protein